MQWPISENLDHSLLGAMSTRIEKIARTKKAGGVLESKQKTKAIDVQRDSLKAQLAKCRAEKKKAEKQATKLRQKANKTTLSELMQIMMMKAYIIHEEQNPSGASSSSSEPWKPANAREAFEIVAGAVFPEQSAEVGEATKEIVKPKPVSP